MKAKLVASTARHKYLRINEGVPAHMPEMADAR